jgi:3-oxoisoapionate decarboxylase
MILGISSFTYGWSIGTREGISVPPMNETDLVNQARAFGVQCLQIGDNLPLHTFPKDRLQALKYLIDKHRIRLEVGARKLTPHHLAQYLDIASYFSSPLLRFVIDGDHYEPGNAEVVGLLKEVVPELRERNIILGIENHDRFRAQELADIMEQVGDDRVGICLDCVNSMGAGEGLEWVARILAPYTVNLHIKDFSIARFPHQMGFTIRGTPAGTGMLNLPWLLDLLAPYHRCQSAILEQWVVPETDQLSTIQKEKEWAVESMHYLKAFFNQ